VIKGQEFKRLVFVADYGEFQAEEARARGYLSHVLVETANGDLFPVTFYDPVRLQQDIAERIKLGHPYVADVGLIVVSEITQATLEEACLAACRDGFFAYSISVDSADVASASPFDWPPPRRES